MSAFGKALRLRMQQYEEDQTSLANVALRFGVHKSTIEKLWKEVRSEQGHTNNHL